MQACLCLAFSECEHGRCTAARHYHHRSMPDVTALYITSPFNCQKAPLLTWRSRRRHRRCQGLQTRQSRRCLTTFHSRSRSAAPLPPLTRPLASALVPLTLATAALACCFGSDLFDAASNDRILIFNRVRRCQLLCFLTLADSGQMQRGQLWNWMGPVRSSKGAIWLRLQLMRDSSEASTA